MSLEQLGNNITELKTNTNKLLDTYRDKLSRTGIITKVDYESIRDARRELYAGSGFIEFGSSGKYAISPESSIRQAYRDASHTNRIEMGYVKWTYGNDGDKLPVVNVDGHLLYLNGTNVTYNRNYLEFGILLPTDVETKFIEDMTNTTNHLYRGDVVLVTDTNNMPNGKAYPLFIKNDISPGTDITQNMSDVEEYDSLSRQDLVVLEVWVEDIKDKDFVYPYGNVQYHDATVNGIDKLTYSNFAGHDTYSNFGKWQESSSFGNTVGKGFVWSDLTLEERYSLASSPEHNIYLEGNTYKQVRYRVRTSEGKGNHWSIHNPDTNKLGFTTSSLVLRVQGAMTSIENDYTDSSLLSFSSRSNYQGTFTNPDNSVMALPLMLVQRLNDGIFHPVFNSIGTAAIFKDGVAKRWNEVSTTELNSIDDCFNPVKIAAKNSDGTIVKKSEKDVDATISGTIANGFTGRTDNVYLNNAFADYILDLRIDAKHYSKKDIFNKAYTSLLNNTLRGREFEKKYDKISEVYVIRGIGTQSGAGRYIGINDMDGNIISARSRYSTNNGIIYNISTRKLYYVGWVDGAIYVTLYEDSRFNKNSHTNTVIDDIKVGDKIIIITKTITSFMNSYSKQHTVVSGEITKLKYRVNVTTSADTSTRATMVSGDYILCLHNTNNNGVINTYYRLRNRTLTNIALDNNSGTPNVDYIDFSDTTIWTNLGTDGEIGGLPDSWKDYGIPGEFSIIPSDNSVRTHIGYGTYKGAVSLSLTRPILDTSYYPRNTTAASINSKANTITPLPLVVSWAALATNGTSRGYYIGSSYSAAICNYNGDGTNDKVDYDFTIGFFTYKTVVNKLEGSLNDKVDYLHDRVKLLISAKPNKGASIIYNFIGKFTAKPNVTIGDVGLKNLAIKEDRTFHTYDYEHPYVPVNKDIAYPNLTNENSVKMLPYLTKINNGVSLNLILKEIKSTNGNIGDNNKFRILNNKDMIIDTNGKDIRVGTLSTLIPYFIKE